MCGLTVIPQLNPLSLIIELMKTLSILLLFSILLVEGCQVGQKKIDGDLNNFNWMTGTWMDSSSTGKMVEVWNVINDSVMVGSSIYLAGLDTIFFEEISLKKINGEIYYIPSIQVEEGLQPVLFKFISFSNGEFIFENKKHDFPQRIVYSNPVKDSLVAYIDGNQKGEYRKEYFRMKRIK